MRQADATAYEIPAVPAGRANFVVVWLAILYVAWQYLMPVVVVLAPIPSLGLAGIALGFVLVILAFLIHATDVLNSGPLVIVWGIALVIIGSLSAVFSGSFSGMPRLIPFMYQIATLAGIYVVFVALGRYPNSMKAIMAALVLLALLNACVAIWGSFTGRKLFDVSRAQVGVGAFGYDPTTGRAGGLRGENYAGTWIAPALAAGLLLLFRRPYGPKGIIISLVSALGIIVSLSRTSAVVAGMVFLAAVVISMLRGLKVRNIVLLFAVLAVVWYAAEAVLQEHSESFSAEVAKSQRERWTSIDQMIRSRLGVWTAAWSEAWKSPLLGRGPGAIQTQMATVPHNAFLDAFVEIGLVGMLVLFLPVFQVVGFCFRHLRRVASDEHLSVLFVAAMGMFVTWMTLSSTYLKIIWMIPALIQGRVLYLRDVEAIQESQYLQGSEWQTALRRS
jgi:O-antigen ligase